MAKKKEKITHSQCDYLLLAKTPNGDVFQVIIDQDKLKNALHYFSKEGKITLIGEPVTGITFSIPKK